MIEIAPTWFSDALKIPKSEHRISVEGASIYYQKWGDDSKPGLMLVHGSGSHSHWWDFIAPQLLDHYQVSALDLSGMGESDRRDQYEGSLFGREILAVAKDSGFFDSRPMDPVICGHSLGGYMSTFAAHQSRQPIQGVIMIDSPIRPPDYDYSTHTRSGPIRRIKTYPDKETILERFRLTPEQDCNNKYILDYIAKWSIRESNGGYEWKFDDSLFDKLGFSHMTRSIAFELSCKLGILYGTKSSMFSDEILNYARSSAKKGTRIIPIENAAHHIPLDQPVKLVQEILRMIDKWK
ncbi:alpha/beta hydrolase [Gammaproteobacteria bacterium]|nr:alpha/beta hydrolase [Gammaproteobacteria bacterium]